MHKATYSIFIFSKICGLAPYSIETTKYEEKYTIKNFDKIFNDIIIGLFLSVLTFCVCTNIYYDIYSFTTIAAISKVLTHSNVIINAFLRLMVARFYTKQFTVGIDGLMDFDRKFRMASGIKAYYSMTKVRTILIFSIRYFITCSIWYYMFTSTKETGCSIWIQILTTLLSNNRFILLAIIILELKKRFNRLNKFVKRLILERRIRTTKIKIKEVKNLRTLMFNIIFQMRFALEMELLCKIIGSSMLSVFQFYQLSKTFSLTAFWNDLPSYIFPIAWAVTIMIEVCILLGLLTNIELKAKKTVQLMEDLEKAVGKSNLAYKQIELFSLQVYVEDFKFSVFGCFPLDWTLLHSMAAGIATYLVIFHQFSNMEKNV
ncbi:hypothetical protein FQA39_LY07660 [Lamprigera yunnana]|nr:hypothetical protein FQA39_LY07660 [Lamprigera yunnana]